jgi:hypothetical protein
MAQDPLTDYLRSAPLSDDQRADLWDLFNSAPNSDALADQLRDLQVDNDVKAQLWDLKSTSRGVDAPAVPDMASRPLDPQTGRPVRVPGDPGFVPFGDEPEAPRPGVARLAGEAVGGALSTVNPINIVSGLYSAVRHPLDTGRALVDAQVNQGRQAVDLFRRGRISEGVGHSLAAAVPLVGPAAARVGEDIGSADPRRMARGLGEGAAMIVAPAVTRGIVNRAAPVLRRGAESLVARTMRAPDDVLAMTDVPNVSTSTAAANTARQQLARTALDEGVVPGLVSSGSTRSRAALGRLTDTATRQTAGNFTPIDPSKIRGPAVEATRSRYGQQVTPADDVTKITDAMTQARSTAAAQGDVTNLTRVTTGNIGHVRGRAGAAADASRAVARDMRTEIGRAAPQAQSTMNRINKLEPVAEAYERMRGDALDIPGLPTIQARILLSGVNRLVGPGARTMDRMSNVNPTTAARLARSAVLADLLGETTRERAR